jgi:hypothetical protein
MDAGMRKRGRIMRATGASGHRQRGGGGNGESREFHPCSGDQATMARIEWPAITLSPWPGGEAGASDSRQKPLASSPESCQFPRPFA